ncbi:MAG: hypothetical protein JWP20_1671 [Roseomonas sp.]|nr:hypothetical protein [Roseomonas sp.]
MNSGVKRLPVIGSLVPVVGSATFPPRNRLLAGLTQSDFMRLKPHLTQVRLVANQTLFGPGELVEHVYFIEDGMVSLTADTGADDPGISIGMIGPEGMAGFAALLGGRPVAFHHTMVQIPGSALRMPVARLQASLDSVPALRARCLRYLDALAIQISQIGACNGRHRLPERCAYWLLAAFDCTKGHELPLTQDGLSMLLGVHRPGVTIAIGALQDAGLIRSARGKIEILDHAGLERTACGCYRLVRDQFDRLLACG